MTLSFINQDYTPSFFSFFLSFLIACMGFTMDNQEPNFKHFCKICKKGFGCGRALGGHMRAHGIGDEDTHIDDDDDDDDPANDWDDKNDQQPSNKRMYALRTNPNRLKSCRLCEHCGKEFSCWKSFLSHDGKCNSQDAESLVSSDNFDDIEEGGVASRKDCGGWSKRKRTLRMKVVSCNSTYQSSEDEDLANCLVMLSNANVEAEAEESCTSASKEERIYPLNFMASKIPVENNANGTVTKGLFECKACKKVFTSHQALGGHRASHKKVKGCYASRLDNMDESLAEENVINNDEFLPSKSTSTLQYDPGYNASVGSASKKKSRIHECSICHRVFSSGQALGGHKRCHWITSNAQDVSSLANFHQFQNPFEHIQPRLEFTNFDHQSLDLKLDLNLPAPTDDPTEVLPNSGIKVSTEFYLHSIVGGVKDNGDEDTQHHYHQNQKENENEIKEKNKDNRHCSIQNVKDEADSKVKLAKLSVLKDTNDSGCSSTPWLQVGIVSSTDLGTDR